MTDYSFNLLNKMTSLVCGLIISVILARFLGVVLRGELAFVVQSSTVIAIVLGLGLGQAFLRFFKLSPESQTFADVVSLLLLQLAVFGLLGLIVALFVDDRLVIAAAALSVSTSAFQQFESIMAAYDIRLKIKVHICYTLARLLAHVLMWVLAEQSLLFPIAIPVFLAFGGAAAYLGLAKRPKLRIPPLQVVKLIYGFGWLPMVTTLLILLNYSLDLIMLRLLGTERDLGIYAVAAGVVTYLWIVPDAIKEVLTSRVVRSVSVEAILLPLKAAVATSFLCVLLWAASGWFLVPVLYGNEYLGSYQLIVILSLGVVAMVYYKVFGVFVMSEGKRIFYFVSLLFAVMINMVLNFLVIPIYGATGAAWVSVASYSFTGACFIVYFSRISGCSLWSILVIGKTDLEHVLRLARRR